MAGHKRPDWVFFLTVFGCAMTGVPVFLGAMIWSNQYPFGPLFVLFGIGVTALAISALRIAVPVLLRVRISVSLKDQPHDQ